MLIPSPQLTVSILQAIMTQNIEIDNTIGDYLHGDIETMALDLVFTLAEQLQIPFEKLAPLQSYLGVYLPIVVAMKLNTSPLQFESIVNAIYNGTLNVRSQINTGQIIGHALTVRLTTNPWITNC